VPVEDPLQDCQARQVSSVGRAGRCQLRRTGRRWLWSTWVRRWPRRGS